MIRERVIHKSKRSKRKPGWEKAQSDHDKWLMSRGVHPSQLKNAEKSNGSSIPNYASTRSSIETSDIITPIQGKARENTYSGEYIVGLATLHKSNTVPVGRGDNPEIYAKMRRG
jgi:hypothetical protein